MADAAGAASSGDTSPRVPREERIALAYQFLSDPRTRGIPIEKKIQYLESKDHSRDELDAALARMEAEGIDERTPLFRQKVPKDPPIRSRVGLRSACCAIFSILLIFGVFMLVDEEVYSDDDSATEASSSTTTTGSYQYDDDVDDGHGSFDSSHAHSHHHSHRSLGVVAPLWREPRGDVRDGNDDGYAYAALSYEYEMIGETAEAARLTDDQRRADGWRRRAPAPLRDADVAASSLVVVGDREHWRFALAPWPRWGGDDDAARDGDAARGGEQLQFDVAEARVPNLPNLPRAALQPLDDAWRRARAALASVFWGGRARPEAAAYAESSERVVPPAGGSVASKGGRAPAPTHCRGAGCASRRHAAERRADHERASDPRRGEATGAALPGERENRSSGDDARQRRLPTHLPTVRPTATPSRQHGHADTRPPPPAVDATPPFGAAADSPRAPIVGGEGHARPRRPARDRSHDAGERGAGDAPRRARADAYGRQYPHR